MGDSMLPHWLKIIVLWLVWKILPDFLRQQAYTWIRDAFNFIVANLVADIRGMYVYPQFLYLNIWLIPAYRAVGLGPKMQIYGRIIGNLIKQGVIIVLFGPPAILRALFEGDGRATPVTNIDGSGGGASLDIGPSRMRCSGITTGAGRCERQAAAHTKMDGFWLCWQHARQ